MTPIERDRCGYPDGQEHPHVEQCHRAERDALREELIALVGECVYDYTYYDTGVSVCRNHGAAGYQAACPRAWLRANLPSVFPPAGGDPS